MPEFEEMEVIQAYERHSSRKESYLKDIEKLVVNSGSSLEGNSFYVHNTLQRYQDLYNKQLNLFWCGTQAKTKICEIGFNAGHSAMLLLLGRDTTPIDFTIFDIGHHPYTTPCLEYIASNFPHVTFGYMEGDSTQTMPTWIEANKPMLETYDVVHVDGGHSEHCIFHDMKNANFLVKKGGIVIVDDTNISYINDYVNIYVSSGKYREMGVAKTLGYQHRIIQKL